MNSGELWLSQASLLSFPLARACGLGAFVICAVAGVMSGDDDQWSFRWSCPDCPWECKARYRASLKSSINRHRREVHSNTGAVERRRLQQATRLRATRTHEESHQVQINAKVFVTSPRHRDGLYNKCFDECLRIGFNSTQVHRRRGLELKRAIALAGKKMVVKNPEGPVLVPIGLRSDTFLMWDFHKNFLPTATHAFEADRDLKVVFWLEDDVFFHKGVDAETLVAAAERLPHSIGWLAFMTKKGAPFWGTHCLSIPRDGVALARQHMDNLATQAEEAGSPLSYLCGLDTWVRKMCSETAALGTPYASAVKKSLAGQRAHTLKGRK